MNFWEALDSMIERPNPIKGGIGDDKEVDDFDKKQVSKGIKHEMEHTKDPWEALDIAADHLSEDPKYYDHLKEAFDDDDDLSALANRFKTKRSVTDLVNNPLPGDPGNEDEKEKKQQIYHHKAAPKPSTLSTFSSGEPEDDPASAMKAAGLPPASTKNQAHQQSVNYTKNWMVASRFADQILTIDDRKEMNLLIQTFAAGINHKRPLSPQLQGRYSGRLLLAHTEDEARNILIALAKELSGEKDK